MDQGVYILFDEVLVCFQNKGLVVFVFGIGKDVDFFELNQIVFGFDNVFKVDLFEELEDKVDELKKGICVKGMLLMFVQFG